MSLIEMISEEFKSLVSLLYVEQTFVNREKQKVLESVKFLFSNFDYQQWTVGFLTPNLDVML